MPYRNMDVIMLIRYKTGFRLPTTSEWLVLRSCQGELLGAAADFLGAGDVRRAFHRKAPCKGEYSCPWLAPERVSGQLGRNNSAMEPGSGWKERPRSGIKRHCRILRDVVRQMHFRCRRWAGRLCTALEGSPTNAMSESTFAPRPSTKRRLGRSTPAISSPSRRQRLSVPKEPST
jgi:hypothetical protein